jgi:hypothetical protein
MCGERLSRLPERKSRAALPCAQARSGAGRKILIPQNFFRRY